MAHQPSGWRIAALTVVLCSSASLARAQTCPPPELEPLQQPPEIDAQGGAINTTFVVQMQEHPCVPVFDGSNWAMQSLTLRTYFYPSSPGSSQLTWSTPGPTLRLRRATSQGSGDGDALNILLVNKLPVASIPDNQCDAACPSGSVCCPPAGQPCPASCTTGCPQDVWPECFHGDNTTNLHFHGTHVSPQAPQDYVLLELAPQGSSPSASHAHGRGLVLSGSYQYAVNKLPWDQAEGTHWYHPHKHGAVSLQMVNGMGGALLITGPFDDWLNGFYKNQGGLVDNVLVIQQLGETLNFFNQSATYAPPQPIVNGQANPVITMQMGEVQRWRFINENMQATAKLQIGFENTTAPTIKQIAQDGVQFAPENYGSQPLLSPGVQSFSLSPGNRADFLVQAPTTPGTHLLTFKMTADVEPNLKRRLDAARAGLMRHLQTMANDKRLGATALAAANPPLLTVNVANTSKPMTLPTQAQWPLMPSFLQDIQQSEITNSRSLLFSTNGTQGVQPNSFFINNKQFDPSCVDETMTIGTAEQWTISNSSAQNHPYHIHINPFQIVSFNGQSLPAPWIWWDTFGLPTPSTTPHDVNAGPIYSNQQAQTTCPTVCTNAQANWNGQWTTTVPGQMSVCGCLPWGSITTRSRFTDYTGEYVIHCHFLGHEDRGMMIGVQTICPNQPPPVWGQTVPAGTPDNCSVALPASPQCSN